MYFYLYTSRVKRELTEQDLVKMQRTTKEIIDRSGMTGFLFFHKSHIVHYFEGENALVKRMYQIVSEDKRLEDVNIIKEGTTKERRFAGWAMHIRSLNKDPLFTQAELANDPDGIKKLINEHYLNMP